MDNCRQNSGFTLVELLIVAAIIAIISALTVPSLTSLVRSSERKAVISELISLINLSRNAAIQNQTYVTLCPVDNSMKCVKDWSLPIYAFEDPEKSGEVTPQTRILRFVDLTGRGRLFGRTGIQRYFRFNGAGMMEGTLGNITWCSVELDPAEAAQIRLNMGGRPRLAEDRDGDGIVEDSGGDPVTCT